MTTRNATTVAFSVVALAAATCAIAAGFTASTAVRSASAAPPPAAASTPVPDTRSFTATGIATLDAAPDCADLRATLSVERPRAKDAAREVHERERELMTALTASGVTAQEVAIAHLRVDPVHHPKTGALVGYDASIGIKVSTRDLSKLPALMEVLAGGGATNLSTELRVDNLPEIKKRVRQMAIEAAKEKASDMATAVGFELGAVQTAVEQPGANWQWNGSYLDNAHAIDNEPRPVHGELQAITMTVSITYDLR